MLKTLKKFVAKTALVVLALQAITLGLVATPGLAHADTLTPAISAISYGGVNAIAQTNNSYYIDATHFTNTQLQDIVVKANEPMTMDTTFLAQTASIPLAGSATGDTVHIADYLGGSTKTAFESDAMSLLYTLAGILGKIDLSMTLKDGVNPVEHYTLTIDVVDNVKPDLTAISFAGNTGTYDFTTKVWSVPLNNVGDTELGTSPLSLTASESSTLVVTSPVTPSPIVFTGTTPVVGTSNTLLGGIATYDQLKSEAVTEGHPGYVAVVYSLTDASLSSNVSNSTEIDLLLDTTGPVVNYTVKPSVVNTKTTGISLLVTADEPFVVNPTAFIYKVDGAAYVAPVTPVLSIDDANYSYSHVVTFPAGFFEPATQKVAITFAVNDKAGNVTTTTTSDISVDTIAPAAVTNLTATVNDQGYVVLNWTNPSTGTYSGLEVKRDGVHLASLPVGTTVYIDTTAIAGQTYNYTVSPYDAAGNETTGAGVSVTVPSGEVASGVSDNSAQTPTESTTATATVAPQEVKASSTKEESSEFPWWGIVILIVLAAVGGWLIYSQKPSPNAKTTPVLTASNKKTTPTKKNIKSKK